MFPHNRAEHDEEQVHGYVKSYVYQLYRGKPHRPLLKSQKSERDGAVGVDGHSQSHHPYIRLVAGTVHGPRNRTKEYHNHRKKQGGGQSERCQRCRIGLKWIGITLMVGKPEKRRLHSVSQHYEPHGHYSIDICHHSVFVGEEHGGIKRHEEPVEKTPHYAAQPVYYCIFK